MARKYYIWAILLLMASLCLLFTSCSYNSKSHTTVTFDELTPALQDTLIHFRDKYGNYFVEIMDKEGNIINENESHFNEMVDMTGRYEYDTDHRWPLNWVYYPVIIEKESGKKMTFDQRTPRPFLMTDSCMYVPTRNGIFDKELEKTTFNKYQLK